MFKLLQQHPRGLTYLFLTEMWERFGFYGMRSLLVLYLITSASKGGLGWSEPRSLYLYGIYIGLANMSAILGGWIADRYLGQRQAIPAGGTLMALGYFSLAVGRLPGLYMGLLLVICGNALFKPCVTAILGQLYEQNDHRRDGGYSLFYMGINLGACLGPLCSTMQVLFGYPWGFALAGVGMCVSMIIFLIAHQTILIDHGHRSTERETKTLNPVERKRLLVLVLLALTHIFFITAFEQAGGLLTIFTLQKVDHFAFGYDIHPGWFLSLNPFFILVLSPVFSSPRFFLQKNRCFIATKMGIGFLSVSLSYLIMVIALLLQPTMMNSLWMVTFYFFITVGELLIIPTLWSQISHLAPRHILSSILGVGLAAVGVGGFLSGVLGSQAEYWGDVRLFSLLSGLMFCIAFLLLLTSPFIRRFIQHPDEPRIAWGTDNDEPEHS